MESSPQLAFSLLSPKQHENIDRYLPEDEYLSVVSKIVLSGWSIISGGFWTSCTPSDWVGADHGWKIHVSSTVVNAVETLRIVASVLSDRKVAFKYCADRRMHRLSLSKTWSRFQAGKFITIYPRDEAEFCALACEIANATKHLAGPYILTDKAFNDSKVVFYRYGAHRNHYRVDNYGRKVPGYFLESGEWFDDVRDAKFRTPKNVTDPICVSDKGSSEADRHESATTSSVLLNDRFLVTGAIKFNASGGIYHGTDTASGQPVILREERSSLGLLSEAPAHSGALQREANLLRRLSDTGVTPKFIALFQAWEHQFLVTERFDAISLWGRSMEFYFSEEDQDAVFSLNKIVSSIEELILALMSVHSHGVVLRDLTRNNVMFTRAGSNVRFVDFELSYEIDSGEPWVPGWTQGYASPQQMSGARPSFTDDYYALGALVVDMITFCASGLEHNRDSVFRKLQLVLSDLSLPPGIYDLALGLTDPNPHSRWNLDDALTAVRTLRDTSQSSLLFSSKADLLNVEEPDSALIAQVDATLISLSSSFLSSFDPTRNDRLWPASPEVFVFDPAAIQYGACGVAWFLLRQKGFVPTPILDWIFNSSTRETRSPSLYGGLGGISLLMLYANRPDHALQLLARVESSDLFYKNPSLYFGAAGQGLVYLHFWKVTRDHAFLEKALLVGRKLFSLASSSDSVLFWDTDNTVYLGLGDGQAGIALFLLYLGAVSNDPFFTSAAIKALSFDLAQGHRIAGRLAWKPRLGASDRVPNLPHQRFGSAGIGSVAIRCYKATQDDRFLHVATDCAHTIRPRVSNKLWQEEGAAGFGEFFLDLFYFLRDSRFRDIAYSHAEAILAHTISEETGCSFPGVDYNRICSDFGFGGSGIGIFLDRLSKPKDRFLFLDEFLSA